MKESEIGRFELEPVTGTPRAIVISGVTVDDASYEIRCFVNEPPTSVVPRSSAFVYGSGERAQRLGKTDVIIDIDPSHVLFSDRRNHLELVLLDSRGRQVSSRRLHFVSLDWLY